MKISIDLKKFLSLPLNDGKQYYSKDTNCGCIKGNFMQAIAQDPTQTSTVCGPVASLTYIDHPEFKSKAKFQADLYTVPCHYLWYTQQYKLSDILDIGEFILLKGYPQKAKLYVAYMIEKFQLCDIQSDAINKTDPALEGIKTNV